MGWSVPEVPSLACRSYHPRETRSKEESPPPPQARMYRRKQNARGALKAEVVQSTPRLLQDNQPHLVRKKGAELQKCQARQCPSVSVLFLGPYLYAVVLLSFLHVPPGRLVFWSSNDRHLLCSRNDVV